MSVVMRFQGYVSGSDPIEEHWGYHDGDSRDSFYVYGILYRTMDEFVFLKEEADTYRQMHLEDAIAFIPYGCMVDEFRA